MDKLSQLTDEELALEYMEGNNRAFDILLNRTQTGIFSYIVFIVRNREVADDIFQDTFLKAIQKLQMRKYSPTGKFNAWMIRIAHNAIMDYYRRQKAKHLIDAEGDDLLIAQMSDKQILETSREDLLANAQVMDDVRNMIDYLPEVQSEIVKMRYYQNLSFKEISEITGASINTCLGRMRYALINMRRLAKENRMQLQLV
ncbi:MAG: sigma-70 family RNA polymerase sigma factor [Prevotella sp.]|jgi:RNA polymerase sigma-70 factor (ECF subfamily)|nr:sigma-70 family RNA polymerase sigma factor [Prevotella sp.]MBQ7451768.1 sigma-70 family RNA polymerase sigma factor [Prevotella sp.]MBQ8058614.1 sigma-70 family RNA polymerase sigma factor [Prevotella sp.]MBQ8114710.1 sigma-70 family RNA polymerase sigma factor [Prevotella sp.]MBR4268809.1 sigma-70 family RNA polymerase sigma factor [Prevotella sp.]